MKRRKIEVYEDGEWKDVSSFRDLKAGDIFRLFEPDNKQVVDHNGKTIWIAASNPFNTNTAIFSHEYMLVKNEDTYAIFTKAYPGNISNDKHKNKYMKSKDSDEENNDSDEEDNNSNEDDEENNEDDSNDEEDNENNNDIEDSDEENNDSDEENNEDDNSNSDEEDNEDNERNNQYKEYVKNKYAGYTEMTKYPIMQPYFKIMSKRRINSKMIMNSFSVNDSYNIKNKNDWVRAAKSMILSEVITEILNSLNSWDDAGKITNEEIWYVHDLSWNLDEYLESNDPDINKIIKLSDVFNIKYNKDQVKQRVYDVIFKVAKTSKHYEGNEDTAKN